jgi:hypothetical protein
MKIIRTKENIDYYDHIAKIYGEDPLLIFKQKMELEETIFTVNEPFPIENLRYINSGRHLSTFIDDYIIVVCGVAYYVRCEKQNGLGQYGYMFPTEIFSVLTKEEFLNLLHNLNSSKDISRFVLDELISLINCCYEYNSKWEFFHELVDSPIFIIQGMDYQRKKNNYVVGFKKETVLLGDIGFSKIKSPLDMFLEMSTFISKSKSQEPPVTLDNNEKIVKSGFDLKQSFRHRK